LRVVQSPVVHRPRIAGVSKYTTRGRLVPIARETARMTALAVGGSTVGRTAVAVGGLGVVTAMYLYALGRWPLIEPDEGRNAEVAREMLAFARWSVPHFNALPYLDKPAML
jgi:hypothetical protein